MIDQIVWPRYGPSLGFPRVETLSEIQWWRWARNGGSRPLLLDLFCGAGGAAMGYYNAGFDVIGVDIALQPNYPFPMIQADAIDWMDNHWFWLRPDYDGRVKQGFHAIHASPPCQLYSKMSNCRPGLAKSYPDLIPPTRQMLQECARIPWVIENVEGAPLRDYIELCGFMFGYELYRHRWFEASFPLRAPDHPPHTMTGSRAGHWEPGKVISVSGHCAPMWKARQEMAISWTNRDELGEAVPPYYTEYVGQTIMEYIPGAKQPRYEDLKC